MPAKARILMAGDWNKCRASGEMLASKKYEISIARTMENAVDQVEKSHFDLAVIIEENSHKSALEPLQATREADPRLKAIVSTSHLTMRELLEVAEQNVFAYLPASSDGDGIADLVEQALHAGEANIETFKGNIKMYGNFVAIIGDHDETLETWLRRRAERYKDKEVKMVLITEEGSQ